MVGAIRGLRAESSAYFKLYASSQKTMEDKDLVASSPPKVSIAK
jgi:hypothetical protein